MRAKGLMSNMKKRNVFCQNMAVSVVLILVIVIAYQVILGNTSMVTAASGYPDTLVEHMQHLSEQDYMFLDVSNMRLQQDGIGPSWNKAATLYYRNVTKGTDWRASVSATSEGLSDEEKKMVRELRQSNIFCWKITDADTDTLEFSYSNDSSVNNGHYYRTAAYKASDIKGNLHAYLASYTAKKGDNEGKKAYMIGQVALPKVEKAETDEETTEVEKEENSEKTEENAEIIAEEKESIGESEKSEEEEEEEEEEEYEVTEAEVMADEDVVTIRVQTDFDNVYVVFYQDGTYYSKIALARGETFQFDCASTNYNQFNIEQKLTNGADPGDGNKTVICKKSEILNAVAANNDGNRLTAVAGGWNDNNRRTLTLEKYSSLSDLSLNIPEGTFVKETENTLYVKATFYDYYSDREMEGTQRKNVTDKANSSAVKVQAGKFNRAISEYFQAEGTQFNTGQSPLYFGDFNNYSVDRTYYNYVHNNNNGEKNKIDGIAAPKQGLVNNKLVNGEVVMGSNNTVVPYFNESFLRGENYWKDNIGYVFNDVEFPFKLNSEGYWEFDSYQSDQSLRMKKDGDTYFLDRTGADGEVKGAVVYTATANSNFFPFNDHSESKSAPKLNYAYGAKIEIPFYMTSDGKVTTNGIKEDIVFNFLGDDDIWIFIDDDLILDLGGDHGAVRGKINFAEHTAVVLGSHEANYSTGLTKKFEAITSAERHVLTLYYMERGLWESNMQITFNFPQSNKLEVEKEIEVPSEVNSLFQKAIDDVLLKQISFPISIKNMATSGEKLGVTEQEKEVDLPFDAIDGNSTGALQTTPAGSALKLNVAGGGESGVMQYTWPSIKKATAGQDATDARSAVLNYNGTTTTLNINTDQIKNGGYLEFKAYLDYSQSGGPFVALIDSDGDRIGGWAEGMVYTGGTGTMQVRKWTTLRISLSKMASSAVDLGTRIDGTTANGTFDYNKVAKLQFAHWAPATVYIDDISIKAPATYSSTGGFSKDQSLIPDYGSIGATVDDYSLQPINGAEYILNPVVDENGNTYSYVNDGHIYLKHEDLALFTDQFRRESYLAINETCNSDIFDTKWEIFEDGVSKMTVEGTAINDEREETDPDNSGVKKPDEATLLFKSFDTSIWEDTNHFFDLHVKYTNTLKLGSIRIKKKVLSGQQPPQEDLVDKDLPYKVRVTFSNIAGLGLEKSEYGAYQITENIYEDGTVMIDGSSDLVITGIPAGTEYKIEELQEDRDDFILAGMAQKNEDGTDDDTWTYDETGKTLHGVVQADEENVITVTNNINPVTENGELKGQKIWSTAEGNTAPDPEPIGVKLKLQRKFIKEDETTEYSFETVKDKDGKDIEFEVKDAEGKVTITCQDGNTITINTAKDYKYSIDGLPLYGVIKQDDVVLYRRKYEYRFVETAVLTKDKDGKETEVEVTTSNDANSNKTIANVTIDDATGFIVTGGTAVADADGSVSYDITNTYDPKTSLEIKKISGDNSAAMAGVKFLLEKMKEENGSLVEDETFNNGDDRESTTLGDGTTNFANLTDGIYRITEIETVQGYSLLAAPIYVKISRLRPEGCIVGSLEGTEVVGADYEIVANTLSITISNQGLLELPMTGSNGRKIVIILGICLAVAGEGLYLWNLQSYRKHRRSHRRR